MRKSKAVHEVNKRMKGTLPQTRSALLARIKSIRQAHAKARSQAWRAPALTRDGD